MLQILYIYIIYHGNIQDIHRYLASFHIYNPELPSTDNVSTSFAKVSFDLPKKSKLNPGWQELLGSNSSVLASNEPFDFVPRKAVLEFKEKVLFHIKPLLMLEFTELSRTELMKKVQERYLNLQVFTYLITFMKYKEFIQLFR